MTKKRQNGGPKGLPPKPKFSGSKISGIRKARLVEARVALRLSNFERRLRKRTQKRLLRAVEA